MMAQIRRMARVGGGGGEALSTFCKTLCDINLKTEFKL